MRGHAQHLRSTLRDGAVTGTRSLPKELRARGIENADAIGAEVAACPARVDQQAAGSADPDPEDVFKSLGRRR